MFTYITQIIHPSKTIQYQLFQEKKRLTFAEVILLWKNSPAFRRFYNQILKDVAFEAYFWEVKPIMYHQLKSTPFEFVLINSNSLTRITANRNDFKSYFTSNHSIVSFPNLGRNAQLVVPCPLITTEEQHYAHIAAFIRNAPEEQVHALWQKIGATYLADLAAYPEKPKWLSTSGLGVYWLHIRIDERPKYYQHRAYKSI